MLEEAPTNELVGNGWTTTWTRWLKLVQIALSGWRKTQTATLTHDFGAIAVYSVASTTLTVPGVRQGDVAKVSPHDYVPGVIFQAIATGNDTVTLYAHNVSSGSVNPAATTFRVIVFQQ